MNRMRSLSFPKLNTARTQEDEMASPYYTSAAHSRESSAASTTSSPITPTFSQRSHNRWPSSSSSLVSTPDSPVNVNKSPLHDLVEDPAERDDGFDGEDEDEKDEGPYEFSHDEPMCICDTPFCEHRAAPTATHSAGLLSSPPEWPPGDDFFCDGELPGERSSKRPRSGDLSLSGGLSARLSRRWPSISKHWKDIKPTTAVSSATVRSAPPSRTTSMRLPSMRYSLATHLESQQPSRPSSHTPVESMPVDSTLPPRPRAPSWRDSTRAVDISFPEAVEDPIDRQGLASTPLLPPMMVSPYTSSSDRLNAPMSSPLQSPTVAEPVSASSLSNTPTSTPVLRGISTPPLSSRQSAASVRPGRSGLIPVSELPPLSIASSTPQPDAWASRLGHANFHISPEPYFPSSCTTGTCKGLLEDWEAARVEYLRLAAHVSEHYGQTSQTYKYTQAKWTGIDSQWRGNYERASSEAGARGEVLHFQPLAKTQLITMPPPSLDDPKKFPTVAEADIVGPMVQYTKIQRRPSSKKAGILRVFTDPASLLGGRSPWSLKR